MKRWTFKTKATLGITGTFLSMQLLLVVILSVQIRSEASQAVSREVNRTWRMFRREQRQREESLLAQARVIADVPKLGATLDTRDPATILALLGDYRALLGGDLYIATDREGYVLARLTARDAFPPPPGSGIPREPEPFPPGRAALKQQARSGFLSEGFRLYQVAIVPVHIGGTTEGTLTLGVEVNDRMAREIKSVSDSDISFIARDRIVASTLGPAERRQLESRLGTVRPGRYNVPVRLHTSGNVVTDLAVFPTLDRSGGGEIAIQRPLGRAIASYRRLLSGLLVAGLCVLVILAVLSIVLAESVTGPVLSIARAAGDLAAGNWSRRVSVASRDELRDLADAFNRMADRLQDWDEEMRREVERRTVELHAALARLDRAYQQMRDFNADAAHEIFTPLTIMRGELEVALMKDRPPEEYRRVLGTLLEEVLRLTRIVEQLLALSRVETGEIVFDRKTTALGAVLRGVCEQLGIVAREKGVRLVFHAGPEVELRADEDRLRQLFINLIRNAVSYSPPGASVDCRWRVEEGRVAVEVADTGPGIAPEHLPRIFDRFYRVDRARSRKMGGSGLGLAICKWIVEHHQGEIEVESEVGKGSLFRVLLPIDPAPAAEGDRAQQEVPSTRLTSSRPE